MRLTLKHWRILTVLATLTIPGFAAKAEPSKHRALLIGNNYPNLPEGRGRLQNAHGDTESMAKLLARIGFGEGDPSAIITKRDATLTETYELWQKALDDTAEGGIAVFFFSGHGFQDRHSNYLLPEGPPITPSKNPKVLETQFVRLDGIMESFLEARQKKNIVGLFIIDACREDVFKPEGTRAIGSARGFAPVRMPNDSETFVLFATAPGQYAYDGLRSDDGVKSSVFTRNLVALLGAQEKDQVAREGLADIAQDVRDEVVRLSRAHDQSQVPTYYDQLAQRRSIFGATLPRRSKTEEVAQLQKQIDLASAAPVSAAPIARKAGDVFSDACPDCPQMVVIPAGPFVQGSSENDWGHMANEGPVRKVIIGADFAMSKFPITNQQWNICVKDGSCVDYRGFSWRDVPKSGVGWLDYFVPEGYRGNKPVTDVSWRDAQDYVKWLSQKSGQTYRLPTESEWEYAARAGSVGTYHFSGKSKRGDLDEICQFANGADVSLRAFQGANMRCSDGYGREAAPVGSYKPNDLGLFDMGGNVWQWVADCWYDDYRAAPTDGSAWRGATASCNRVARGGSWRSKPEALRPAARNAFSEHHARPTLGFRVARTLK